MDILLIRIFSQVYLNHPVKTDHCYFRWSCAEPNWNKYLKCPFLIRKKSRDVISVAVSLYKVLTLTCKLVLIHLCWDSTGRLDTEQEIHVEHICKLTALTVCLKKLSFSLISYCTYFEKGIHAPFILNMTYSQFVSKWINVKFCTLHHILKNW